MFGSGGQPEEAERNVATQQVAHRGTGAAVRHRRDLRLRHQLEQFPGHLRGVAGRRDADLPGLFRGQCGNFFQRLRGQARVRHRDQRNCDELRDEREILQRPEADVLVQPRRDRQRAHVGDSQRVAIRRGFGAHRGAEVASGAGAVVDDDLIPRVLEGTGRDRPDHEVGAAARREGNDDAHRLCREFLRMGGRCSGENTRQHGATANQTTSNHRCLLVVRIDACLPAACRIPNDVPNCKRDRPPVKARHQALSPLTSVRACLEY